MNISHSCKILIMEKQFVWAGIKGIDENSLVSTEFSVNGTV